MVQRLRLVEVLEELVTHAGPAAALHGVASGFPERPAFAGVAGEIGHARTEVVEVPRAVQPPVDAHAHQVQGSATPGRDDGDTAGMSLLECLSEGLALPRVHEQVERRDRCGERVTVEVSEEMGIREHGLELRSAGPVPDDHEPGARDVPEDDEVLDLFLGGEPTDVADHDVGAPGRTERGVASRGLEALGIDPSPPAADTVHTECGELLRRIGGGREGHRRPPVQSCDVRLSDPRGRRHPVPLGVGGHVRLIRGDARDVEPLGGEHAPPAESERGGEMDDVGREASQGGSDALRTRRSHPHVGVAGQSETRDRLDRGAVNLFGDADGGRSHDMCLVTSLLEVAQDLEDGAGDAVHVRKEGFCDDRYSHIPRMTALDGRIVGRRHSAPDVHRMLVDGSPAIRSPVPESVDPATDSGPLLAGCAIERG